MIGVLFENAKIKSNTIIAVISRNGILFFPTGKDELKAGDRVIVVTKQSGFSDIDDILEPIL